MGTMETTTKVCSKCKVEKSCDDFSRNKTTKDGLQYHCRECIKKYNKENVDKIKSRDKKWRQENSHKKAQYDKEWRQNNVEKSKQYRKKWSQANPDKVKEKNKKRRQINATYFKQYQANRRKSDHIFRLISNLRTRIGSYCRAIGVNKTIRTKEMLGLNLASFKSYMESKFQEGMTWENYGQWHVDHIKPLSLATIEQQVMELNHYTNLQPLWAADNIKKSNKYEESH